MRTKSFGKDAELVSDKALRKFQNDLGDHLKVTMDVIDSDNKAYHPDHNLPNQALAIDKRLKKLGMKQGKIVLPIDGNDIMKAFNIQGGPMIGKALSIVMDLWYENPKITKKEALKAIGKGLGTKNYQF